MSIIISDDVETNDDVIIKFPNFRDMEMESLPLEQKSIYDQVTLIKERIHEIDEGNMTAEDKIPSFVKRMEEIGSIRKGLKVKDMEGDPDVIFDNMVELDRIVHGVLLHKYIDTDKYELIERLILSIHFMTNKSAPEPELPKRLEDIEVTTKGILCAVTGIGLIASIGALFCLSD